MPIHLRFLIAASLRRSLRTVVPASIFACAISAQAVIVRGVVHDPLGSPIAGARVQLREGAAIVALGFTGSDGYYEIRSSERGRFTVLTLARGFSPVLAPSFYGSQLGIVRHDVTLSILPVTDDISVTATGLPTPIEQTSASVSLIPKEDLATRAFLPDELRLQPGVDVVQTGQNGGVTSLFVRGGNSDANKVVIDGVPADDVGGRFDFGNLSSTAIATAESHRGPDSVLYGSDALAGAVRLQTPRGSTTLPLFQYSGDAGNFGTYRNEGELSGAWSRFDYYTAFSRFDSANALKMDQFHNATSAANIGWNVTGSTQIRGTVRQSVSATGLPDAHDFNGISSAGKQGDQNTFFTGAIDNTFHGNWHNLFRYYGARKREQSQSFFPVGTPVTSTIDGSTFTSYYGNTVTIRGGNGYTATGRALINYPIKTDLVNNRDGVQYQSDYRFGAHLSALLGFRYEDERGAYRNAVFFANQNVERRNYDYSLQLQGDFLNRIFYTVGGAFQKNYLFGTEATPRIGVAGYVIRPGSGWFHGTKLRFNFSKGVQEPSLASQTSSLYNTLLGAGLTSSISSFHVSPIGAERSRMYEGGGDQSIYGDRVMLHVTYFHTQFGRQIEFVDSGDLTQYFGIPIPVSSGIFGAYLNSLDFKAQGFESQIEWRKGNHIFVRGGYTYLDAKVEKSFSGDATSGGLVTTNPDFPNIPIGGTSPLVGARPFRRAPHTGYIVASYTRTKWSAAFKTSLVSNSDDSTFLTYSDFNGGNSLLLPNRNLDFGYTRMDLNANYQVMSRVTVFSQVNNLLGQQHTGPIGYPGLPFNFRTGLKVRLGGQ